VQQPAEAVNALNNITTVEPTLRRVGDRRFEVDAAVRAFLVVVGDELSQDALGMALAPDEQPVQALRPGCEHEPLGESVRPGGTKWRPDNSRSYRSHHLVEGPDEFAVPATDKEAERSSPVLQNGNKVPRRLGDNPGAGRVSRYPGTMRR